MQNTLTVAELKRRGAAAIEDGLKRGPIRIMKHNKSAGVVLSEREYERLLASQGRRVPGLTAMEWLLAHSSPGRRGKRDLDRRLRDERNW
jgi:hypothetical protein